MTSRRKDFQQLCKFCIPRSSYICWVVGNLGGTYFESLSCLVLRFADEVRGEIPEVDCRGRLKRLVYA